MSGLFFVDTLTGDCSLDMKKRRRIRKLTIERERTYIFRSHEVVRVGWCDQCDADVEWLTVAAAARQTTLSELVLYRLIEAGDLHVIQEDEVNILACLNSVRCIQRKLETGGTAELNQEGEQS